MGVRPDMAAALSRVVSVIGAAGGSGDNAEGSGGEWARCHQEQRAITILSKTAFNWRPMQPLIIEAALNGPTTKKRNPRTPTTPAEVAADALACLDEGASIIHTHVEDFMWTGDVAAAAYLEGWAPILSAHPDVILYSTIAGGRGVETRFGHYRPLAKAGMRMGAMDPGSVNLATAAHDGLPGPSSFVYATSYQDLAGLVEILDASRLGPSIAIYEPGFLRTTLAYERAGKLPAGAFVKFYFAGDYNLLDGKRSDFTFGLPPTKTALAAYREMMAASALPWAVSVIGGCVTASGMTRLAIESGGHVRLGLEDFGGDRKPSNAELVAEVVAMANDCGRKIATSQEAAQILGLPR